MSTCCVLPSVLSHWPTEFEMSVFRSCGRWGCVQNQTPIQRCHLLLVSQHLRTGWGGVDPREGMPTPDFTQQAEPGAALPHSPSAALQAPALRDWTQGSTSTPITEASSPRSLLCPHARGVSYHGLTHAAPVGLQHRPGNYLMLGHGLPVSSRVPSGPSGG